MSYETTNLLCPKL